MTLEMIGMLVQYVVLALALCLAWNWAVEEFFDWFVD